MVRLRPVRPSCTNTSIERCLFRQIYSVLNTLRKRPDQGCGLKPHASHEIDADQIVPAGRSAVRTIRCVAYNHLARPSERGHR